MGFDPTDNASSRKRSHAASVSHPNQLHRGAMQNRTSQAFHNNALTNGRSGGPPSNQKHSIFSTGHTTLTTPLKRSNLHQQTNVSSSVYDPSNAPAPSDMTAASKRQRTEQDINSHPASGPTSNPAGHNVNQPPANVVVCKHGRFERRDFHRGDIISIPHHTANMDPKVNPADERLTLTVIDPAYSKRRMMIIMWMYERDMFCLPLFTFGRRGMDSVPWYIRHEYVSMINESDDRAKFVNEGKHPPVVGRCKRKPLDAKTTVHITGGMKIACNEDICKIGEMPKSSFFELMALWEELSQYAQSERY